MNTIIDDLKSVTKENLEPHCSKYDTPVKIGISADTKMNRKRPPLKSIDNRLSKRSSSAIIIGILFYFFCNCFYFLLIFLTTERKPFEETDKLTKFKKHISES